MNITWIGILWLAIAIASIYFISNTKTSSAKMIRIGFALIIASFIAGIFILFFALTL